MNPTHSKPHILEERPSYGKENALSYSVYEPTDRLQNDNMLKEFQTLKQINRILDSNPESEEAKDQKIRSLVVMFKRQLDINKKFEIQLIDSQKKLQTLQKELLVRKTQVANYEKTIFQQKQTILEISGQNKKLNKIISENKEQIQVREDLIQKMKETYENQKQSMENELHFLKQKTIEHFTQKLNFPIESWSESKKSGNSKRSSSKQRRSSSKNKENKSVSMPKKGCQKKDMIRKNILAISKKENEMMSGERLLRKFEETRMLSERMGEIRKGNYYSSAENGY